MNKLTCLIVFCILFSCKEDDPIDVRKQAAGSYDYTGVVYYLNKPVLIQIGNSSFTGSLEVALDPSDNIGLLITESTNGVTTTYKGQKLAPSNNGFSFDIASQPIASGSKLILSGYEGYQSLTKEGSSTLYHGGFDAATKIFGFWWQYRDENTGTTFVVHMKGTKK